MCNWLDLQNTRISTPISMPKILPGHWCHAAHLIVILTCERRSSPSHSQVVTSSFFFFFLVVSANLQGGVSENSE